MIRVKAQEVGNRIRLRRRIFDEKVNAAKDARKYKLDYVKQRACEYLEDILFHMDVPAMPTLIAGHVRGFEETDDFLGHNGTVDIEGWFQDLSGVKIFFSTSMPLYRGELLRPATIKINGQLQVFGDQVFANVLELARTIRPELKDMYLPSQSMERVETTIKSMFQVEDDDDPQPYFDLTMPDRENNSR